MALPDFSVVIPVYNNAKTIARAIESVVSQTYQPREIIVVDDGSTDDTPAVVSRFGDTVRYLRQANAGVSVARNAGVVAARSKWLAFLDGDDWYYPHRLSAHAEWIARNPRLDFLTGDFEYRRPDQTLIGHSIDSTIVGRRLLEKANGRLEVIMEEEELGLFVEQHFGDTHTLSLPRSTFDELGGYTPGISVCEDVNFLIRLCARSRTVGAVCTPLAVYCVHGNSATRANPLHAQRETLRALLPLVKQLREAPMSVQKGLSGCIRRARMDLAVALLRDGQRVEAVRAVIPLLGERPNFQSLRDVLSVVRG